MPDDVTVAEVPPFGQSAMLCPGIDWDRVGASFQAAVREALTKIHLTGRRVDPATVTVLVSSGDVPGSGFKPGDVWVRVTVSPTNEPTLADARAGFDSRVEKLTARSEAAEREARQLQQEAAEAIEMNIALREMNERNEERIAALEAGRL